MKETIRTFIAIKINPEYKLLTLLGQLKRKLEGESIKWVEPDNMHLTLRFIGETTFDQVKKISELLENVSKMHHAFDFKLGKPGYFKSGKQPRVIFLNIENDTILKKIVTSIEDGLVELGFEREQREFKPHLTLGRIKFLKSKEAFYSLMKEINESDIQQVRVTEIIYYQSILSSAGPKYKPLKVIKLD